MTSESTRGAIGAIYAQLQAPEWAAANLDGLADVLRDLSWLPPSPVRLVLPDLSALDEAERQALLRVLAHSVDETSGTERSVHLVF